MHRVQILTQVVHLPIFHERYHSSPLSLTSPYLLPPLRNTYQLNQEKDTQPLNHANSLPTFFPESPNTVSSTRRPEPPGTRPTSRSHAVPVQTTPLTGCVSGTTSRSSARNRYLARAFLRVFLSPHGAEDSGHPRESPIGKRLLRLTLGRCG